MSDERLRSEVERLRQAAGPALCDDAAPCEVRTSSEVRIKPNGQEERTGAEMRPLCGPCPNRGSRAVRHVEVRLDLRNRHRDEAGEEADGAATMPHNGTDRGPEEYGAPPPTDADVAPEAEDGLPAAWGPDHPARLALQGREPPPPRRRGDGGPTVDPADFGLS